MYLLFTGGVISRSKLGPVLSITYVMLLRSHSTISLNKMVKNIF